MPSFDQCSIAEFSNSFLVSPSPSVCTINIDGWESCKYRKMKHKHNNLIISQIDSVIDTLVAQEIETANRGAFTRHIL